MSGRVNHPDASCSSCLLRHRLEEREPRTLGYQGRRIMATPERRMRDTVTLERSMERRAVVRVGSVIKSSHCSHGTRSEVQKVSTEVSSPTVWFTDLNNEGRHQFRPQQLPMIERGERPCSCPVASPPIKDGSLWLTAYSLQ